MLVRIRVLHPFIRIIILLLPFSIANSTIDSENSCFITKGGYQLAGICKPLGHCGSAISELRSGINVDTKICHQHNHETTLTCCPTEQRISEKKCSEYQKILMTDNGPVPLLPFEFLKQRSSLNNNQVHCRRLPTKLIVGGRDAAQQEFPHQLSFLAALGYGSLEKQKWLCGGVVISPLYILTAAHCLEPESIGHVQRVLLGTVKLSSSSPSSNGDGNKDSDMIIMEVAERIAHPLYKQPSAYHDIALLKLKSKVKLSRSILPACLPQPNDRLEKVNQTQVTGWGMVEALGSQSDLLQIVHLTRLPQKTCEEIYNNKPDKALSYQDGILRSQFCAGDLTNSSKDSCNGDSGGPATVIKDGMDCTYYVIGLVSFGSVLCGVEAGVYTNVQSYLDWIEQVVWPNTND